MNSILRGLYAGLSAGAILALLYFVDYGPGNSLSTVASWFGIASIVSRDSSKWIGLVLLLVLGGLFGVVFGALQRNHEITFRRTLVTGLALGLAWWVIFALLVALIIGHVRFTFGSILFSFITILVYGLLLGTLYFQSTVSREISVSR